MKPEKQESIWLDAVDCTITNNDLSDNEIGVSLSSSNNNKISGNRANSNKLHGIQLVNSEGNTLLNNNVNSNTRGINSITSNKNTISDNNALNNSDMECGFHNLTITIFQGTLLMNVVMAKPVVEVSI